MYVRALLALKRDLLEGIILRILSGFPGMYWNVLDFQGNINPSLFFHLLFANFKIEPGSSREIRENDGKSLTMLFSEKTFAGNIFDSPSQIMLILLHISCFLLTTC